jgi:hypothetical protein
MTQTTLQWVKAASYLPKDYSPYICVLRGNAQGDDALRQRILHYDFKKTKTWYENDPSCCVAGHEKPVSEWESVIWWKPIDWPRDAWSYGNE